MWKLTVPEVVSVVGGRVLAGETDILINGFASLKEAAPGDLSFFNDHRYESRLQATSATAVLVPEDCTTWPPHVVCIGVADPSASFELMVNTYGIQPQPFAPGVHPSAVVSETAQIDRSKACVGANAVIEDGAVIADGVEIGPGCFVGRNVTIGRDSKLHPNSTILTYCELGERVVVHSGAVVGADGFGYEFEKGRHRKVRQSGIVQIDNDVEIGAGTTIDRARFGRTWIGEGTKIDNLVQIGHNVVVGRHCIIVACTAVAGSVVIGDYVVIAAQVGIAGHVVVGAQSKLGARSGVTKDVPAGSSYFGFPARDATDERRRIASSNRLPLLMERVKELEARLQKVEAPHGE
jgi:UDP-3-O-[3-hydroxymyristoyl] glucosamine N-acyltransferase